jgi:glycosyltransferase involved in cell wall biosynthesis
VQILFVHPNFPAQFGPLLQWLAARPDVEPIFVSQVAEGQRGRVRCLRYALRGGATASTHYCSRTFENAVWHAHAVYEACKAAPDLRPDLIIGHSGFGTTVFLQDLYGAPIVNYFEYYYRSKGADLGFRTDFPHSDLDPLRARTRNAMILLDLEACVAGYAPTQWQWSLFPDPLRSRKLQVHPDGVDLDFWSRRPADRQIQGKSFSADEKIVTYVSRGFESMRGFDLFIRIAKRLAQERSDVTFVVVGSDQERYGSDAQRAGASSFKDHVLGQEQPDLSRFQFTGTVAREELARILSLSDLHIYLTVPFVLSWSLLNAMACSAPLVASATAPVLEVLQHEKNALLADFYEVEEHVQNALRILGDPALARSLGTAARQTVEARFDPDVTYPRLWQQLLEKAALRSRL